MRFVTLILAIWLSAPAFAFDQKPIQKMVQRRLEAGDLVGLSVQSYDAMFKLAEFELDRKGYPDISEQLRFEWGTQYRGMMLGMLSDAGDHEPISQWVADWYQKLENLLGVQMMELTHLRDIWVLNFTTPVVFKAAASNKWCVEQLAKYPEDSCKAEYRRHFAGTKYEKEFDPYATAALHHGFSGVVTYWVVWGVCEAATYGSGWFIVCTPAGDLAEIAIEKFVAPGLSDKLYDKANK